MRSLCVTLALWLCGCPGGTTSIGNPDGSLSTENGLKFPEAGPDLGGPPDLASDLAPTPDLPLGTCTAMAPGGGLHLNPGCDPDVQVNGVTAVDIVTLNNQTTWLVVSGKKHWSFDMTSGAFTAAGPDFSTYLKGLKPGCSDLTSDGIPLNPGCDLDVQVNGITAIGNMTSGGKTSWAATSGKKWWSYDLSTSDAFVDGGKDFAAFMRLFPPTTCATTTADGLPLNAGCDPDVQSKGLGAIDIVTLANQSTWLVTCGKKWWSFDMTTGAFSSGGKDFSTYLKGFQPGCSATTSDGLPLNPGCDADVQVNGISALGSMTQGGKTSWAVFAGKKWWSFDLATSTFVGGGKDVAAFFRTLPPTW